MKGMAKGGVEHEDGSENGTVLRPGASEAMDNSRRAEAVSYLAEAGRQRLGAASRT